MRNRLEVLIPTARLHTDGVSASKLEEAARVAAELHTLLSTLTRLAGGMTFTTCVGEWRGEREDITRFTWWHEASDVHALRKIEQAAQDLAEVLLNAGEASVMFIVLTQYLSGQTERAVFYDWSTDSVVLNPLLN